MDTTGNKRLFRAISVAGVAALAVTCVAAGLTNGWPQAGVALVFIALTMAGENAPVDLPNNVTISPQALFVLGTLAFDGGHPGAVVTTITCGVAGGLVVRYLRRRAFAVVAYNSAQFGLSAGAAAAAYELLRPGSLVAPLIVAPLVYVVANVSLIVPVVAIESGLDVRSVWRDVRDTVATELPFAVMGVLLGNLFRHSGSAVVLALLAPAVIARIVFAVNGRARQALERVDILYGFTQRLENSRDERAATASILEQTRELLRAHSAELTTLTAEGWQRTVRTATGSTVNAGSGRPFEVEAMVAGPLLSSALKDDSPLRQELARRAVADAVIAPLRVGDRLIGTLAVADRYGGRSFRVEDLRLLETLASHAAVSLDNARLMDQLRWDSRHDQLTKLANRTHFHELVAAAKGARGVLLVDLDRFKEINDALGHAAGDRLLVAVADRLVATVPPQATVARLGGDEFAVVVPAVDGSAMADVAHAVVAAMERPFAIDMLELEVTASVGVAMADGEVDPAALLQEADVAMYQAKGSHSGWELYSPERDRDTPHRLDFATELRRAIDTGELVVHYQPKASMSTDRVTGVEALVRWQHPQYGLLAPDSFIPVAEQAGLIRALTGRVLSQAAAHYRELRAQGFDLNVAVNLSVRSVLDVDLPDQVAKLAGSLGMDPTQLTLEVTEGSVMTDPDRTIGVLDRLAGLGIRIALDDFGTGYSSLAYLKRLPASEIKVDRSFVSALLTSPKDEAIVRSTIDLAHHLGLRVVAEGVEDEETWARLVALGCDEGQGFAVSPPLSPDGLHAWLSRSRPPTRAPRPAPIRR